MKQQRRTERALLVASVLAAVTLPSYAATGIQDNSAAFTTNAVNAPVVNAQDAAQYKQAEKAKADKTVHIEPISVTAAGFTQLVKNSPADITVITKEEIARKNYTDFAGLLSDVEGIDVRGSNGRMGAAGVSIRGMDQKYTLIMVDGVPVNGASSQDIGPNGMYQQIYSFIPQLIALNELKWCADLCLRYMVLMLWEALLILLQRKLRMKFMVILALTIRLKLMKAVVIQLVRL